MTHSKEGKRTKNNSIEYRTWANMVQRCYNTNRPDYKRYGGIGITMCSEWKISFERFYEDMGERPEGKYSLDRIDNDKGYYKENCRWATDSQQMINRKDNRISNTGIKYIYWNKSLKAYQIIIVRNKIRYVECSTDIDICKQKLEKLKSKLKLQ